MKIVFTGGGTGGHFYPIIAVTQRLNKIIDDEKILGVKLYYISDAPYDKQALFENEILFEQVDAGKIRTYFSFKNFTDIFKMAFGTLNAIYKLFLIYPDVVFGKGGYASFPTLFAAWFLRIPVFIHESDSAPGRVNKWAGKFAKKVAISFNEAADYFPKKITAWTGNPIRAEIEYKAQRNDALEYFKLDKELPVILILGGSQGAELINNIVIDSLPSLLQNYQIIHQTGVRNFKAVTSRADVVLKDHPNKVRYIPYSFMNPLVLKMAAGATTLVISRAGSTLFEIASWGLPSILIPFHESNGDHARKNAFNYARHGACAVIEEMNMSDNIFNSEINRILNDKALLERMAEKAKEFSKPDAAYKIAKELLDMAIVHER